MGKFFILILVAILQDFAASEQSIKHLFGCAGNEICQMSMKSEQGKYVSAMGYHDRYEANANAETIGSDEIWEVIFKGDDKVSLKGAHGRYLRAYGNGQVKADAEKPNPWETFIVEDMGNGKLAFISFSAFSHYNKKKYLTAESDGALTNQDAAEAGTKFEIVPAADLSLMKLFGCAFYEICQMSMKSEQGKYVSAMGYHDRYEANANAETIGSDEIWEVIFKGDDTVSLKGAHGRYLRAYGNGQVKADAQKPNPWETFIVEDMGDGKLGFLSYSAFTHYKKKNYLVAEADGALTNRDDAEAGTKFEIVPAADIPCPAKNQDMLGNDIHIQVVGSWDECGSLCYNHSSCKYWTWIEDYNGLPQYCFLKDANSGLSYLEGVISGEKKCMAPKAN